MATTGIRGEVRLDDSDFAAGVRRVAKGSADAKASIEQINDADLTPVQRRINEMFTGPQTRYSSADLFSAQQRSYASGFGGDMRNVQGFKGAQTAAELRRIAAAAGRGPGGAGQAMLELGHAAQDAQYGLKGVLNNLPGLAMGLGMRAGPVGAFLTAIVVLVNTVPKLIEYIRRTKEIGEANEFLTRKTKELATALESREKAAAEGTARGQRALAAATRDSAEALALETMNMRRNTEVAAAMAEARGRLEKARVSGDTPEAVAERGRLEIEGVKAADAARVTAIDRELTLNRNRVASLEEYASAAQQVAAEAQAAYEGLDPSSTSADGLRMAKIHAAELAADAKNAKEAVAEASRQLYAVEVDLLRQREVITKTSNDRIEAMALELQGQLTKIATDGAQKQIDTYKEQMDAHIAWKEQVDETVAREKELEADREKARQREREASVARIAIAEATARGDEREAAALERKQRIMQRIHQLREMGFSQDEADAMANAENPEARRMGRNGRPRIGRTGRGRIDAGGIGGDNEWELDRIKGRQRSSLRAELDARIGEAGEAPRSRRVTRERESGSTASARLGGTIEKMAATLTKMEAGISQLAAKERTRALTSGEQRNFYFTP